MNAVISRQARFPWTWALLVLVALDLVCRAQPVAAGLIPWIDGLAVAMSIGLLRLPLPQPAPEHVSNP